MTKEKEENKIILSFEQVKELAQEVEATSHQAFLIKRKCIKVDQKGQWSILQYEGLTGSPAVYGYDYESDIPYMFWDKILKQVDFFIKKKKEKSMTPKEVKEYAN